MSSCERVERTIRNINYKFFSQFARSNPTETLGFVKQEKFDTILALSPKLSIFRGKWRYFEITKIKIDFCLKNCFLALYAKLSVFRGKGRYFEITL